MRQIGTIADERQAKRFSDYLLTQEIASNVEPANEGWAIWIREEDQLERARQEFEAFQEEPQATRYAGVEQRAEELRRNQRRETEKSRKQVVEMRDSWQRQQSGRAPLTMVIIILCSLAALESSVLNNATGGLSSMTSSIAMRSLLFLDPIHVEELYSELRNGEISSAEFAETQDSLAFRLTDIRQGQIWRIVTPAFLHGGLMHLVMNMWTLWIIGTVIERRYSTAWYGVLILLLAIPSTVSGSLAPLEWGGSPFGLGFSGVLFGFIGYIWMKSVYDPASGLYLPPLTLIFVLVFLGAGFTTLDEQLFGARFDNWGHGIGLLSGMLVGIWPELMKRVGLK